MSNRIFQNLYSSIEKEFLYFIRMSDYIKNLDQLAWKEEIITKMRREELSKLP